MGWSRELKGKEGDKNASLSSKREVQTYLLSSSLLDGLESLEDTLLGKIESLPTLSDGHEVLIGGFLVLLLSSLLGLLDLLGSDVLGSSSREEVRGGVGLGVLRVTKTEEGEQRRKESEQRGRERKVEGEK